MSPVMLDEFLSSMVNAKFDWSSFNCCHFAGRWVRFVEGSDPMEQFPPVTSKTGAARFLKSYGGSLKTAVTTILNRPPIRSAMAKVGDIVLLDTIGELGAIGICAGRTSIFLNLKGTRTAIQTLDAACAWRVESL